MGTEDEILMGLDEGKGLLDRDKVPNENQSLTCFSCDARMVGLYCHECGNKNDNYRRSVFSLVVELFQNLTAMDGRMWRSLRSLIMKPGQMAREYSDGARSKWTSPVRLYIATSILLFGYITVSQTQVIAAGTIMESQRTSLIKVGTDEKSLSPRLHFFVRKSQLAEVTDENLSNANVDDFLQGFADAREMAPGELQTAIDEIDTQIEEAQTPAERQALRSTRDVMAQVQRNRQTGQTETNSLSDNTDTPDTEDDIFGRSEGSFTITGSDGQDITLDGEGLRDLYQLVTRRPELINNRVNNDIKMAMFFMMPLAMIMGAIFIRGRSTAMLYDHLVHAAYVHAFSFLLLHVFILLGQYTPIPGLLGFYTLILLIYLPISAKRAFQRGWFKSFLTAYGVGAVYSLVMVFVFSVITLLAIQDVAADISEQRARYGLTPSQSETESLSSSEPETIPTEE